MILSSISVKLVEKNNFLTLFYHILKLKFYCLYFGILVCFYVSDDLRDSEMIDLDWLECDIYVVLFYEFESDSGVDLRVIFVKVCEQFDW